MVMHIKINWNPECSNTIAIILPIHPSPRHGPWGWGQEVKIQVLQNMVMLHINLKGNQECSNMLANILPADPHPPSPDPGGGVKIEPFSEHGHVAYQIKWNHKCNNIKANILPAQTSPPPPRALDPGTKRSKFNFFRTWSCYISN